MTMSSSEQTQPRAAGEAAHTPTPWDVHSLAVVYPGDKSYGLFHTPVGPENENAPTVIVARFAKLKDAEFAKLACHSHAALVAENRALRESLAPFSAVADEYDRDCLDECRPEWNNANDEATELYTGRGGKPLLSLHHFLTARSALASAKGVQS